MQTILAIDRIRKSYGSVQALKGVSFDVPKGSIFGILGPNGSGKTTLLSILLDVLRADDGSYSWEGQPASANMRKKIGSLLETPNFYPYLNAVHNLQITQNISGRGNAAAIDEALRAVKLYERRKSKFKTFSLGMKQRLAIAGALLGKPSIILLDEPTNGLDPVGIAEIRSLMIELQQQGHTIIMASHLLDEVEKVCTHVAILKNGELITNGPVEAVLSDEDLVEVGAADLTVLSRFLKGRNFQPVDAGKGMLQFALPRGEADLAQLNQACFNEGIVLNHLALRKKRLEARFFELTNN